MDPQVGRTIADLESIPDSLCVLAYSAHTANGGTVCRLSVELRSPAQVTQPNINTTLDFSR